MLLVFPCKLFKFAIISNDKVLRIVKGARGTYILHNHVAVCGIHACVCGMLLGDGQVDQLPADG